MAAHRSGSRDDPWNFKTPPGKAEFTMYRDEAADPPALVCQVGATTLSYQLRCLDDLHTMLTEHGDRMALGAADEQKPAAEGHRRGVGARRTGRAAAGTASRRGCAGALPCPPLM